MFTELVRDATQTGYHNTVVRPFAEDFRIARLSHLRWKQGLPGVQVLSMREGVRGSEDGGLSPSEAIELRWLDFIHSLRQRHGDQPFGLYAKYYLNSEGNGAKDRPFLPRIGISIFDSVPGLLMMARSNSEGIYFKAGNGPYNPLLHLSHNFTFSVADECPFNHWQATELQEAALEYTNLMRRSAQTGFANTIKWYNAHAETYAQAIRNVLSVNQLGAFEALLPTHGLVFDAGCGAGRDSHYFSEKGHRVVGLDLSTGLLADAVKNYPGTPFVLGSYLRAPLPNQIFDGAWVHGSLHHLETEREMIQALNEISRVLKPGGALHIATQAQVGKEKTAVVVDTLARGARFYHYLTLKKLQSLVERSGFKIQSLTQHKETEDKVHTGRVGVEWLILLAVKE